MYQKSFGKTGQDELSSTKRNQNPNGVNHFQLTLEASVPFSESPTSTIMHDFYEDRYHFYGISQDFYGIFEKSCKFPIQMVKPQ